MEVNNQFTKNLIKAVDPDAEEDDWEGKQEG